MKKGWEIKKLGEVCDKASSNIAQNKIENDNGDYPIYGASGFIKNVSFYHQDKPFLSIVKDGAGVGRVTRMDAFTSVIGTLQYILPKENIDLDYLNYSLMSVDFKKYVAGAAIPHIYFKDYQNEPFLWMPLPEQQSIVSILDECFSAIEQAKFNTEKNLNNAKELFQSELNKIFLEKGEGWVEKKLGEVLQKTETIDPTKTPDKEFIYVDVSSVNKETLLIEEVNFIKGKDAPSRARKLIKTNDVIFATVRPTLKRIAIIKEEYNEQVCSTGYFVLRTNESLNNKLVFYYLLSFYFQDKMEKLQKGASYPAVTDNEVRQQIISFPSSLKAQQKIVSQLNTLSTETKKLETLYQQKLNELEVLKKSILQKAFSGELVTNKSISV